jgi:CheY-like chemotaxis protein
LISFLQCGTLQPSPAQPSPAQLAKGVGSSLEITASLEDAKYNHPQSMKQRDETNKNQSRLDGIRVLLAEDMPDHQLLLKNMITLVGGAVDLANDGEEAVTKALAGDYDIILMDIKMPKLNGYEATIQLRAAGYQGPIVALTACAMLEDIKRCEEVGCNAHLAKPVVREKMTELIFRLVKSKGNS